MNMIHVIIHDNMTFTRQPTDTHQDKIIIRGKIRKQLRQLDLDFTVFIEVMPDLPCGDPNACNHVLIPFKCSETSDTL